MPALARAWTQGTGDTTLLLLNHATASQVFVMGEGSSRPWLVPVSGSTNAWVLLLALCVRVLWMCTNTRFGAHGHTPSKPQGASDEQAKGKLT